MKKSILILAGLISFLLTSLTQLPAHLLTDRLPAGLPLTLQGVSGSLWQGSASNVSWQQLQLRNVQWDLHLSALFKGQLAAGLQAQLEGGDLKGTCGVTFAGKLHCRELTLTDLPAQALQPYLQGFMPLRGKLQADLASLDWAKNTRPNISGQLEWQEAGVQMNPRAFGNYTAVFSVDSAGVQQISLNSAPEAAFALDGQGSVQVDGAYQLSAGLRPNGALDEDIKQFMAISVGMPQADGSYHLEKQGNVAL
ncbi:MAG: type II secretion system protein N [Thiothrix sp.]|uniref:type II secretion system protein N n=1 Tax=Thiothrix sp. TaxID=1032 RepID=UPI00260E0464|nr:type II secretion system protein N [Thiothrix sp.]MDD5391772.1 type II secretion system protein N [Thiothrix sp.]